MMHALVKHSVSMFQHMAIQDKITSKSNSLWQHTTLWPKAISIYYIFNQSWYFAIDHILMRTMTWTAVHRLRINLLYFQFSCTTIHKNSYIHNLFYVNIVLKDSKNGISLMHDISSTVSCRFEHFHAINGNSTCLVTWQQNKQIVAFTNLWSSYRHVSRPGSS